MYLALRPTGVADLAALLTTAATAADRVAAEAAALATIAHVLPLAHSALNTADRAGAGSVELTARLNAALGHRVDFEDSCPSVRGPDLDWLDCQRTGEGTGVVVVGARLAEARHVAVLVPGVGTTLDGLGDEIARARHLAAAAGPDTSVVVWADYDAPGWSHAGSQSAADDASRPLRDFLRSLPVDARVTVIGHSYGSLVAASALRSGGYADVTVLMGSPGVGADSAAELMSGGQLYVLKAPGDVIASLGAFGGVDPAGESFGAIRLTTSGAEGHSAYLDPGTESLANVAALVRGNIADLHVQSPSEADRIADRLGEVVDAFDDGVADLRRRLHLPGWADAPLAGLQRVGNGAGQLSSRGVANAIAEVHDLWDHAVGAIAWG